MQDNLYNFLYSEYECSAEDLSTDINPETYRLVIDVLIRQFDEDIHPRISLIDFTILTDKPDEMKLKAKKELPSADLRIRDLTLQNFRKFPNLDMNIRWGLDAKRENSTEACSLFLTGNNGTGKTSLFNALEFLYTGHISTMEERVIAGGIKKYITHGYGMQANNRLGNSQVVINCMDGNRYTGIDGLQFPGMNFCSDYDTHKFSQNEKMLDNYILEYMGYREIEELISYITTLKKEYDNSIYNRNIPYVRLNRKELAKSIEVMLNLYAQKKNFSSILKDIIKDLTDLQEQLSKITLGNDEVENMQKVMQLTELHEEVEHVIERDEQFSDILNSIFEQYRGIVAYLKLSSKEKLHEPLFIRNYLAQQEANVPKAVESLNSGIGILYLLKRWIPADRDVSADDIAQFINTFSAELQVDVPTEYVKSIQEKCNMIMPCLLRLEDKLIVKKNELIKLFYDTSSKFVCEILNYFSDRNERFEMKYNEENKINFSIEVTEESGSFTTGPKEYFNTFRYKLFVVSLKVALSFAFMKEYKCLLPVVIDDIFNSSDFNNGYTIEFFVRNVYWTFDKLLGELFKNRQLQIILFTHDELVVHSFKKGYLLYQYMVMEQYKELRPYNIICGRLFDYKDVLERKQFVRKVYNNFDPYINLYAEVLKW
jgi:hypothetical protein